MRPLIHSCLMMVAVVLASAPALAESQPSATPAKAPPAPESQLLPTLTNAPPEDIHVTSLFYTPDEIKRVHFAISAYVKRTTGHGLDLAIDELNFLNQLNGSINGTTTVIKRSNLSSRYYVYPQFFLESLVYHSPEDWAIWLNDQKITPDTPGNADLKVLSIDADKVVLEWKPEDVSKVMEVWSKGATEDAEFDRLHGKVRFELRPNQTFTSYSMRVLEGKAVPMQIDTAATPSADNPVAAVVDKIAAQAQPSDAKNTKESDTGLSGLLNSYKNIKKGTTP